MFNNEIAIITIVGLVVIVSLLILVKQIINKNKRNNSLDVNEEIFINSFNILALIFGIIFTIANREFDAISYVMLLLFIIWLLKLMYLSLKENRLNHFYLAEVCFTVEVLRFILVEMDSLMLRGIVCIITAIIILVINKIINKKEKAKNEIRKED